MFILSYFCWIQLNAVLSSSLICIQNQLKSYGKQQALYQISRLMIVSRKAKKVLGKCTFVMNQLLVKGNTKTRYHVELHDLTEYCDVYP